MSRLHKVATVQFEPVLFEQERNIARLLGLCEEAAAAGARLIVTPEMGTTGYCWFDRAEVAPFVEQIPGPTTDRFAAVARKHDCFIVLGMPEVDEDGIFFNTAVLIASSFTLARARKLFKANDQRGFRHWWGVTTILGAFFLLGQIIAWQQLRAAGLFLATNPSSSFFYVFTAAHGLHLLGGVLALTWIMFRPTHRLTKGTATEVGAMYWHFMDGLWVFLFLLFLLGR